MEIVTGDMKNKNIRTQTYTIGGLIVYQIITQKYIIHVGGSTVQTFIYFTYLISARDNKMIYRTPEGGLSRHLYSTYIHQSY